MQSESALAATPVLRGHYSDASITDKIADIVLVRPVHRGWFVGMAIAAILTLLFLVAISSASVTRAPSSPRSYCCCGRAGAPRSTALPRR